MSINWVMTAPSADTFIKLPNEQILFKSPPRVTIEITTSNTYPGAQPFSIRCDGGIAYITTQRIVYLPAKPTDAFKNFSCPILNLHDTYVRAPFFGSNYWQAAVQPVSGGGIPSHITIVDLKMYFRDGGAFDYHNTFVEIKERVSAAVQIAREQGSTSRGGPLGGIDMNNVHLDQLPAYEATGTTTVSRDVPSDFAIDTTLTTSSAAPTTAMDGSADTTAAPNEPPPGYEETQMQAVGIDLDRRLREEAETQHHA